MSEIKPYKDLIQTLCRRLQIYINYDPEEKSVITKDSVCFRDDRYKVGGDFCIKLVISISGRDILVETIQYDDETDKEFHEKRIYERLLGGIFNCGVLACKEQLEKFSAQWH